jgi:outer membrane receptor protein involved in Fe transport
MEVKSIRLYTLIALLLLTIAVSPLCLMAQVAGGSISGIITDSTAAVIPGAEVKITHRTTGIVRTETTTDQGYYSSLNLPVGEYDIAVSAPGFETITANRINVSVGAELKLDLKLVVGNASTTIDVTASVATVDLGTATLGGEVSGNEVRELPLNGRDWTSLAGLQPGVVTLTTQSAPSVSNQRANSGYGIQMTIGGLRPDQNNYRLDGVSINDYSNGSPADVIGLVLGVDAIQEFTVSTNTADASYGRGAGGVVNSVTRQGSNKLHGSAFEFARNSALDAKNYFDSATRPIPSFSRNQYGGTLGGPIRRDHTFIFGAYEGLHQDLGITNAGLLVPSRAAIAAAAPAMQPFFALFPLAPASSEVGNVGTTSNVVQQLASENFLTFRVDETLSPKDSAFGTYVWDANKISQPDIFQNLVLGNVAGRQTLVLEETHNFTQALINAVRFGFNRTHSDAPTTISVINKAATDPTLGFVPGRNVGTIAVTGWTSMPGGVGGLGEYTFFGNSFQGFDDGYYSRGRHSLKFGAAFERIQKNQTGQSSPNGSYQYASITSFLTNGSAASFTSGIGGTNTPRDLRVTVFGVYLHDSWRVAKNLTANLGVRYEMSTVPTESKGKLTNLPTLQSSTPNLGSPYFSNPTLKDFQPRVGLAWDPFGSGKTSIRAGFGVYDNLPLPQMYLLLSVLSAPYYQQGSISNTPAGNFPLNNYALLTPNKLRYAYLDHNPPRSYGMQWNLNLQRELAPNLTFMVAYVGTRGLHLPYQDSDVNIVLPTLVNGAYTWPTPKGSGIRQNPNIGQVQALFWNSTSTYHGLQAQLTRSLSHGFQIGASYTYSKALDTESSSNAAGAFNNSIRRLYFCPRCGKGLSDFDTRHIFNLNYIWRVPGLKANLAERAITGGWEWSGITTISTGQPTTPTISGDAVGMNGASGGFDYPNRIYGPAGCKTATNPHNATAYFNLNCFQFPNPATTFGNIQRNSIIGPGLLLVGSSFSKNIPVAKISDSFNIQLRADIFNLLNHANFNLPFSAQGAQIFTATGAPVNNAGALTSTSTTSRQLQLSAKVSW